MAIDFCVDYACEAKQMLGADTLLGLVQARAAFDATRTTAGRRGEQEFWTRVVRGPERDHIEMVTIGNLRRQSNRLIEFTADCDTCPANVRGEPVGCFGRITYPIDAPTERYLAAGASAIAQTPEPSAARSFVEWIDEGPVDGARVRRMREVAGRGIRFFELPRPVEVESVDRTSSSVEAAPAVTTDQLIEMMFFAFPSRSGGFHFSVPRDALISHRAFLDFVLNELDLGHRQAELADSTTFDQLRLYARALAIAEGLHVDLLVD